MRALDHLRFHLALAGALLIEWLHRQLAAVVVALIAVDLVVATVGHPAAAVGTVPRQSNPPPPGRPPDCRTAASCRARSRSSAPWAQTARPAEGSAAVPAPTPA